MSSKKLIIDADDFGLTRGINEGIKEVIKNGVVTNTGVMVYGKFAKDAKQLRNEFPDISIGLHLELKYKPYKLNINYLIEEFDCQFKKFYDILGFIPDYFNSHRNVLVYPNVMFSAIKVAKKWGVNRMRTYNRYLIFDKRKEIVRYYIRNPKRFLTHTISKLLTKFAQSQGILTADRLITVGHSINNKKASLKTWLKILNELPKGISEIYCHPGYPDDSLRKYSSYVDERKEEIKILTSPVLKKIIKEKNIQLISFKELING